MVKFFGNTSEAVQQLEAQLKDLQKEIKYATRELREQKEENAKRSEEITKITKQQDELMQQLATSTVALQEATKLVERASIDIASIKPQIEKKMLENFNTVVEQELANTTNKIQANLAGFTHAKEVFHKHAQQSEEALKEMQRFKEIARQLKEKDFTLEKYARELEKNDQEKLRLLQKIDKLESMLAKMKRR